ncbi:hypothetical protein DRP07_11320 [Archaeoglobales archaeon]|nr:MAG: hypothetical protein DRP07_11320 [Archaeoglobales archaeon]
MIGSIFNSTNQPSGKSKFKLKSISCSLLPNLQLVGSKSDKGRKVEVIKSFVALTKVSGLNWLNYEYHRNLVHIKLSLKLENFKY